MFGAHTSLSTPAFGTSSFGSGTGTPAQQSQSTTSFFGASQPQAQQQQSSSFGGGFGGGGFSATPQQSTTGFGATPAQSSSSIFGTPGQSSFSGFTPQPSTGSFSTATPAASSTNFGTTFGAAQPQSSTTSFGGFGGFGGSTQSSTTGFGASAQPSSTSFSGFGGTSQPQQQSTTGFSTGFGATSQPAGFGASQTGGSSFGFGSALPQTSSTSFGGFGTGSSLFNQPKTGFSFSSFGQPQQSQSSFQLQPPQQQQQQQQQTDEQAAFHQSIFGCCKFGDERDSILANLNYVQGAWGKGKGYFNQGNIPVIYNDKNVVYRFKAVGYSFMYNETNEDGQVVLHIKKPHKKASEEEAQLITSLQNMLAKPNIFFKVMGSRALNEDTTTMILTADDRTSLRRILATDLASALSQPQFRPNLENLGIILICAKVKPSPEQLKAYLETAPAGIDPRVWKSAQEDNPDPFNMIPIPLLGPYELDHRIEAQQKENNQHFERLKLLQQEISDLQNRHAIMTGEIKQLKLKTTLTQHRVVSGVVRTLIVQKQGVPPQPEEDEVRKQLMELLNQLNSPTHFRGRLNEIMSQIRLQKSSMESRGPIKYAVDTPSLEQLRDFLNMQQGSIIQLVDTVKACKYMAVRMSDEITELNEKRPHSHPPP